MLAGIQFTHILDFMVMMPLGPVLMEELAIDAHQFGLLVSSYTFTAALAGMAMALVADRFERKRLLLVVFALFGLATLACALAGDYVTLLAARGLAGAFGGVMGALVQTMVGDLVPFERRGRASGIIMSAFSLSTVAGVPLSLWIANLLGWRAAFLAIAVFVLLLLLPAWRLLPTLRGHLPAAADAAECAHPLAAMGAVLRDANHLRAYLFMGLAIFSGFTVIPYITIYVTANVGIAQADIPLIYLAGGCATFFTARWIGRRTDLWGKARAYRRVALFSLLPLFVLTHLPPVPLWALLVCTTVFFILVPGRMVPVMAIVTSAAQPHLRGTFLAINASVQNLCSGLAAYLGGLLIALDAGKVVGYGTVGWLAMGMTVAAMCFVSRVRHVPSS